MPVDKCLTDDQILLDVQAGDKWELLSMMLDAIMLSDSLRSKPALTRERLWQLLTNREHQQPSGLGHGFAFPHARLAELDEFAACVAFPSEPVPFDAMDGRPADLVFMVLAPEARLSEALNAMSHLARLARDEKTKAGLLVLKDPNDIRNYLRKHVCDDQMTVTAGGIMRPPFVDVYPDTPLREVTRILHNFNIDAISVVERDGTLVGQITSSDLFKLGMPDFFSQLKSIAFISEFDPFEEYFRKDSSWMARDVMTTDYAALPENATLLEVVFELAVRKKVKVFVVRDGKRIGIIDSNLVLDRIINF